jgi:hypothetical protein
MKQSVIDLNGVKVTIKEITPRDAKLVLANFYKALSDPKLDMMMFIEEKYDHIVDLTKNFIVMPANVSVDELGFSDIDLIIEEFKVVNKSFLDKLVLMGVLNQSETTPKTDLKVLKKPSTTQ